MSSGTWTVILIAVAVGFFFLLTNFPELLTFRRSRVPGLKKRSSGPRDGTYSIKFYPDREAIAFQSSLPSGGETNEDSAYGWAKVVVFFTSFELFYYSNGSVAQDTSGPLREQLRRVLSNPDEPTWEIVEWDRYEKPLFRYDGELFRNALTVPGILGIDLQAKDLSLVQGVKSLVGQMVNPAPNPTGGIAGVQSLLVRHAVRQLLDLHEQAGPACDRAEAQDRAAHTWTAALASVRGVAA